MTLPDKGSCSTSLGARLADAAFTGRASATVSWRAECPTGSAVTTGRAMELVGVMPAISPAAGRNSSSAIGVTKGSSPTNAPPRPSGRSSSRASSPSAASSLRSVASSEPACRRLKTAPKAPMRVNWWSPAPNFARTALSEVAVRIKTPNTNNRVKITPVTIGPIAATMGAVAIHPTTPPPVLMAPAPSLGVAAPCIKCQSPTSAISTAAPPINMRPVVA